MSGKDKPARPMAILTRNGLAPLSAYDAEELANMPSGTEFDLVSRTRRSLPQHRTYWQALTKAVEATGRWPSREALHTALKVKLGRVEPIMNLQGQVIGMRPDSTAFDAMRHEEFRAYFDEAMAALSDALGYDALEWMEMA